MRTLLIASSLLIILVTHSAGEVFPPATWTIPDQYEGGLCVCTSYSLPSGTIRIRSSDFPEGAAVGFYNGGPKSDCVMVWGSLPFPVEPRYFWQLNGTTLVDYRARMTVQLMPGTHDLSVSGTPINDPLSPAQCAAGNWYFGGVVPGPLFGAKKTIQKHDGTHMNHGKTTMCQGLRCLFGAKHCSVTWGCSSLRRP